MPYYIYGTVLQRFFSLCAVFWHCRIRYKLSEIKATKLKNVIVVNELSAIIPATRRSTTGDRAFIVAAASVWNKLPQEVRSATSLSVFRRRLKTHLFDCV